MNLLPSSTVRLIASSQVITSVSSVVKELIENSLDAGATSIEVRLDGWGLERIEVRDNGCGVSPEDAPFMAQPHYTSKISSDDDLKSLHTYGFRGEALGSLASVSNVSVLTKTESEQVGMLYTLERNGKIGATQPKPAATGTTIIATNLFKNLPVRKQFSSNSKKCKDELKKVEDLVIAYGLVHPSLRISLRHNKAIVWQKSKVSNHRTALLSVFGTGLLAQMGVIEFHDESSSGIHVLGYLPKPGSELEVTGRAVNDRCFVFFNGRPVNMKQISQLIKQYYNRHTSGSSNRYPVAFISITLPPDSLDVNLEPNKTSVMLTNKDELITLLTNLLDEFYSDEKNKICERKSSDPSNAAEKETMNSKNGSHVHVNEDVCNGNVRTSSNVGSVNGQIDDGTNTLRRNGEVAVCLSNNDTNEKSNQNGTFDSFDETTVKSTESQENSEKAENTAELHVNNNTPNNTTSKDSTCSLSRKESASSEAVDPINQDVDKSPNSSAKKLTGQSSPAENCNVETCPTLAVLNTEDQDKQHEETVKDGNTSKAANASGYSEKGQDEPHNIASLSSTPSNSQSVEKLFSLDLDELFDDSDLDFTCVKSNLEVSSVSSHVQIAEKTKPSEMPSSVTNKGSNSVEKSSMLGPSGTAEVNCSDKEWNMGHRIDDKQGKPVEPVLLLTPGPPKQLSLALNKTPVTPLHGKRKHSSDQSRLSLSSKKIKKIPEITNQPLINKVMSPNPMQRKLLYKKTEIPFCLNALKELAKRNEKKRRSLEEDTNSLHLIGRLDPWGVWLLRKGTKLVCVNQYRVQEQLLFQRLMECHSLPKERINHPIALNERIVGGPECWRTLCGMNSKCDPPDTTRMAFVLTQAVSHLEQRSTATVKFIDDERLTANGFDVCLKTDSQSRETKVEVYKMSTSIPFYGVPDLAEVLERVRKMDDGSESNSLSSCRPFKVIHYLQGEAVRVARSLSSRMNRKEISDIISRMEKQISQDTRTCIHGRPFFETIAELPKF